MSFAIRQALPSDAEGVARLSADHDNLDYDEILPKVRGSLENQSDEVYVCVAVENDSVIGYGRIRFVDTDERKARNCPSGFYLNGVIVSPDHRRRGVGMALTQHRMQWAEGKALYYFADVKNEATIELHNELGFREITRDYEWPGHFKEFEGILFGYEP